MYSGAVFEPEVLLASAGPSLTIHCTYDLFSTSHGNLVVLAQLCKVMIFLWLIPLFHFYYSLLSP